MSGRTAGQMSQTAGTGGRERERAGPWCQGGHWVSSPLTNPGKDSICVLGVTLSINVWWVLTWLETHSQDRRYRSAHSRWTLICPDVDRAWCPLSSP